MANTFQPKDDVVSKRSLEVQRLVIPFKITAAVSPASKTLRSDEPSILFLNTQNATQVPLINPPSPSLPPGSPDLGNAFDFMILGASAITNTGATVITGDLGLYPGTSVTGFPPGTVAGTQHITDSAASLAQVDALAAYNAMRALSSSAITATLDGQTLSAGVYRESSGTFNLAASGNATLTLSGSATDVWIFNAASTLITGAGGIPTITLTGGALASNVYWTCGSSATINSGSAGTFSGTVIALASITDTLGGTINGRLFALTGAVTLSAATTGNLPGATPVASIFDLAVSDSSGAFNIVVNIIGSSDLVGNYDEVLKVIGARVFNRATAGVYQCYPNAASLGLDSTLTQILLNVPSGVNLGTTDLDACLEVEYIVNNLK